MFWGRFARQKIGTPIRAVSINRPQEVLEGLMRAQSVAPLVAQQMPGAGPVQQWAGPLADIQLARTGGNGVPARNGNTPGSADVTFHIVDAVSGNLQPNTVTTLVFNLSRTKVGANTFIMIGLINGGWWVLWEDCAAS